jgi:ADP-ribose pyrophosphatase YjhB (NUDIX family)
MEQTFKAAGILAIDRNTGCMLLVKRSPLCTHPNTWATVGGGIDEGEDPRDAAIREFKEEVQPDEPYKLSRKPIFISENGNVKFYTYLGVFDSKFVPALNEENIEYGWFNMDSMPDEMLPACKLLFSKKRDQIEGMIRKFSN